MVVGRDNERPRHFLDWYSYSLVLGLAKFVTQYFKFKPKQKLFPGLFFGRG